MRRRKLQGPGSIPAPWQEYPGKPGTHVFIGGLPLHATEDEVVELFREDPPEHCTLEPVSGKNWQDGMQTGRRRYCVVTWNSAPKPDMLRRVATSAKVGGREVIVVVL